VHALFAHGLSPRTIFSINPAFWSLATEMQFYAVYPVVAWAGLRFGLHRVLVAALVGSLAWRAAVLLLVPPTLDHFMLYRVWLHGFFVPRWFEWILGCWLAEAAAGARLPPARPAALAGAALLALAMATRLHVVIDKLAADALFSLGFALIVAAVLGRERVHRAVGGSPGRPLRALAAIGRRSYGTYLVHQPILDGDWLPLPLRLLLTAVTGGLFSLLAERPFERWSRRGVGRARPPLRPAGARAAAGSPTFLVDRGPD
jgi:peptidoglycan/LPS O-acetylase OafA/YrhL